MPRVGVGLAAQITSVDSLVQLDGNDASVEPVPDLTATVPRLQVITNGTKSLRPRFGATTSDDGGSHMSPALDAESVWRSVSPANGERSSLGGCPAGRVGP